MKFTKASTYNEHKNNIYNRMIKLIDNYKGLAKHVADMSWINFDFIEKVLDLNKDIIIHTYEKDFDIHQKQKKLRKNLGISGHKLRLFHEQVHLGIINHSQRKYILSFLDFPGEMCRSTITALSYINSEYVVLTVKLAREKDYWNRMLSKEDRYETHKREFDRAGFEECEDYYEYPSMNPEGPPIPMRVYFLKKI